MGREESCCGLFEMRKTHEKTRILVTFNSHFRSKHNSCFKVLEDFILAATQLFVFGSLEVGEEKQENCPK